MADEETNEADRAPEQATPQPELTPRQKAVVEWQRTHPEYTGAQPRMDRRRYDLLVESFRSAPKTWARAARTAGTTAETARKAWEDGWPSKGLRPIRDVLAEEAALVRKRMAAESLAAGAITVQPHATSPDAVRVEAAERRLALERKREWAELCRANRGVQARGLALVHGLFDALMTRSDLLERIKTDRTMTPETYLKLVKAGLGAFGALSQAVHSNLQTENLAIGEPTQIVGLQQMSAYSWEEAQAEVREAQESLDRLRASGKLAPGADLQVIEVECGPAAAGGAGQDGPVQRGAAGADGCAPAGAAGAAGVPATSGEEADGQVGADEDVAAVPGDEVGDGTGV